jgi:mono/diheme cytochrome c family protein
MEGMMVRLEVAGIALVGLLTLTLGFGCAQLEAQSREGAVARGRELFSEKGCYGCHTIGAAGTPIASDLVRTGARHSEATLARWLRDPAAQEATHHMPNLGLSEAEAVALAAYLTSLR